MGAGDTELFGDLPGRQPGGARLHQQPEHLQAVLLGQGGQRGDGGFRFHISIIMKLWPDVKWPTVFLSAVAILMELAAFLATYPRELEGDRPIS